MILLNRIWRFIISLFDVSKDDSARSLPTPNADDNVANRMAHNTAQTTYKTESNTNPQRISFKNGLILTYDSENRISSAYGYIPEASTIPLFIIAKEGYDVFTDILEIDPPTV